MFSSLSEKFSGIFERLRGRGVLKESDVDSALREIRLILRFLANAQKCH